MSAPQYSQQQPAVVITQQPSKCMNIPKKSRIHLLIYIAAAATTVVMTTAQVGPNPQAMTCPHCK